MFDNVKKEDQAAYELILAEQLRQSQ